jgi:hypothetical protein
MKKSPMPFEKSKRDNEKRAPGKEGTKREERYDSGQKPKRK